MEHEREVPQHSMNRVNNAPQTDKDPLSGNFRPPLLIYQIT